MLPAGDRASRRRYTRVRGQIVDRRATQSGVSGAEILTFGSAVTGR
jgi:hypothetical protein